MRPPLAAEGSSLIAEFHDRDGRRDHSAFQRWRRNHPAGFFLAFRTADTALLHRNGGCHHPGPADWDDGPKGASLTKRRKVAEAALPSLLRWARANGVKPKICADCNRAHGSAFVVDEVETDAAVEEERVLTSAPDELTHLEGGRKTHLLSIHERNPIARKDCLAHHGRRCAVCNMSFEETYGAFAKFFIEVHHRRPFADAVGQREVDPINDLVPVCSNCHRMLHHKRPSDSPMTPEELARRMHRREGHVDE